MNDYQKFIHTSRYARWLEDKGRRETWDETVDRYISNILAPKVDRETSEAIRQAILKMEVMPSMRAMMTAGEAAQRDNTCMYNCYYNAVDSIESFSEAMFILMCGTGVGFSVERQNIAKLPAVPHLGTQENKIAIVVDDSKEGWADALHSLLTFLYGGHVPTWDLSLLRPAGARLKTFGGRSSGPGPLDRLFKFIVSTFINAQGRKLTSLECHDIMCMIGDTIVVGGVRRSAMISLSNLSDDRMRGAKSGQWWEVHPYRALANNSAVYTETPDSETFLREWLSLIESKSGERGIFNRQAAAYKCQRIGRDHNHEFGTNPCGEIILRPGQFCNLSEVVMRFDDTEESLKRKIELATIIGTIQATYTHFPFLRDFIKGNTEEERLLGVSLTGIYDGPTIRYNGLTKLREHAKEVNHLWADKLGIPHSAAITCVKPSGTVSQLVDSASGIHPRYSQFYIRTVRADNKDPLTQFLKGQGVPNEPSVDKPEDITVFSFPTASPDGAVTRTELCAEDHLNDWSIFAHYWCDHNPSVTINVKDNEWVGVGAMVYEEFDSATGLAFLPYSDHVYEQAPYQEITEKEYTDRMKEMPVAIDWSLLKDYENSDNTKSSQTFACTGDTCEVVDI